MTEIRFHQMPPWRDVMREQIRAVALSLRIALLIVVAVLTAGTVIIVGEILGGGPGFDSNETFPTALIAFLLPFAVWRGEQPFGPGFLWTLPVDRRRLTLAKVFAGGVWLMVALAGFVAWLLALALVAGVSPMQVLARVPVTATMAMYLFGSALVIGLRHPLRWLLGAAGLLLLFGVGSDMLVRPNDGEWRHVPGAATWFSVAGRGFAIWRTLPDLAEWAISTVLLLGLGFTALVVAASRHRERRQR